MAKPNESKSEQEVLLALFQAYLEDMGRIGGRHETLRQFYISVISVLFVFLAMAGKESLFHAVRGPVLITVGLVGIVICLSWFLHMLSLAGLFRAKLATLCEIEKKLPFEVFTAEKNQLSQVHRVRLTTVDRMVAVGFIVLFVALLLYKVE